MAAVQHAPENWRNQQMLGMMAFELREMLGRDSCALGYMANSSGYMNQVFQAMSRTASCGSWFAIWRYNAHEAPLNGVQMLMRLLG